MSNIFDLIPFNQFSLFINEERVFAIEGVAEDATQLVVTDLVDLSLENEVVKIKLEVPYLNQESTFVNAKVILNGQEIILERNYLDSAIFENSYHFNELGLNFGDGNFLTLSFDEKFSGYVGSEDFYTSQINILKSVEESEEQPRVEGEPTRGDETDHATHSKGVPEDTTNPDLEYLKEKTERDGWSGRKELTTMGEAVASPEGRKLGAKIHLSNSEGPVAIKFRVNANMFKGAVKDLKDLNLDNLSEDGQKFIALIGSYGYQVGDISLVKTKAKGEVQKVDIEISKTLLTFKQKRKIESFEALYAFNKVASILLTEPYLYLDTPQEVEAEIKSIQEDFGKNVLPSFFQTLEFAACGISHTYDRCQAIVNADEAGVKSGIKNSIDSNISEAAGDTQKEDTIKEAVKGFAIGAAVVFLAPLIVTSSAVGGGLLWLGAFSGAGLALDLFNSGDDIARNNARIRVGVKALGKYLSDKGLLYSETLIKNSMMNSSYSFVADEKVEKSRANNALNHWRAAISKTGEAGTNIHGAINIITGRYFAALPVFKHFEDVVYKIGASSALNLLLKPDKIKESENTYDYPTNLYSEQILGSEASEYLYKLLAFPWYEYTDQWSWSNQKLATEVFKVMEAWDPKDYFHNVSTIETAYNSYLTYNMSKNDWLEKNTLFNIACQNMNILNLSNEEFRKREQEGKPLYGIVPDRPKVGYISEISYGADIFERLFNNKKALKFQQEKKRQFLLTLRDAIVQEVIAANATEFYEDPKLKRFVEKFSKGSVFKIADTTAYPDIDLPKKIMSGERVNVHSPDFYYFKPDMGGESLKRDNDALRKVISQSALFKRDIRERVLINKPIELGGGNLSLNSRRIVTQKSGSVVGITGTQDEVASSSSSDSTKNFASMGISNLPVPKFAAFETKEELENYIDAKKAEIKKAEDEVNELRSAIGRKSFSRLVSEEEVDKLIQNAGAATDTVKALSSVFGLSKEADYNSTEELIKLGLESNADSINSLSLGMARAFPTFRFYIVEEDAIYSNKMTLYDDFFSYASVISFTSHSSRELPAGTAQIVLQNVSGVLDGSKKEVLRDIDIDSRKIYSSDDDKIVGEIESIVLRPGVNAQLRAGYSATCNELDILISGRITEVQYSNDGMTTNITLQSYGVELDQKIENNLSRNNKQNLFYSTHQLLGSLILSPQLKHFGRIKTGKVFQDGENKSLAIDNRMPNEGVRFSYYYTNIFTRTLGDNAVTIGTSVILLAFAKRPVSNFMRRFQWFQTTSAVTSRWAARGYNAVGSALQAAPKLVQPFIFSGRVLKNFGARVFNIGNRARVIRGDAIAATAVDGVTALGHTTRVADFSSTISSALLRLKNGVAFSSLEIAEQSALRGAIGTLPQSVTASINSQLVARGLTGTALDAATYEAQVLFRAIAQQGPAFRLTNFTTRGLSVATEALSGVGDAALTAAATTTAAARAARFGGNFFGLVKDNFIGVSRGVVQTGGVFIGGAGIIGSVGLFMDVFYNLARFGKYVYNEGWDEIFKDEEDDTLRILLSPQDDNLFLPSSQAYLRTANPEPNKVGFAGKVADFAFGNAKYPLLNYARFGSDLMSVSTFSISYWLGLDVGTKIEERFKEFKGVFDTRLNIDENENFYYLKGQTIFDVFHEMTLRHPGYIYGARPYGDSMEYRMFFGLPNQRYWAEDLSTVDALRVNKIIKDLVSNEDRLLSYKTCMLYYPVETKRFLREGLEYTEKDKTPEAGDITQDNIKNLVRLEITKVALDEYLKKTKRRFVPFRKMHLMHSSRNIVANNIIVSGHNVINTVSVNYSEMSSDGIQTDATDNANRSQFAINLSVNTAIPPDMQKPKTFSSENIIGPAAAYRYAIGQLMYGARNMYEGSVLTLGNPKINPWDVLIINDEVNRMYGPVEVKEVKHMFSHETGFLTDVEVNALVSFGEDALTYPTIMSSILGQAKEQIFNRFASRKMFEKEVKTSGFYEELIGEIIEESIGDNAEDKFKSSLKEVIVDKIEEEMEKAKREGDLFFLRDVLENDIDIPEELVEDFRTLTAVAGEGGLYVAAGKTVKFGYHAYKNRLQVTAGKLRIPRPVGVGTLAFLSFAAAGYFFSDNIAENVEDSLNSGRLGKNLFRPVLMSKVSNQSIIEVYPLVKDGKPLLAGGLEGVPASQSYQNILGNIFSDASDGLKGYLKERAKIEKYGAESLYTYDDRFIRRKLSPYNRFMVGAKAFPITGVIMELIQ